MRYDFNPNCNLNGSCIWEHADRSRSACLDETLFNAHRPKILCSISTRLLYVTNYSIRTEKVLDFLANLKNNTIFSTVNVFTRLLPGTTVIGASLMPTLNPVGHLHKKKVGHLRRKNVGHLENYFTVTFRNDLVSIISFKLSRFSVTFIPVNKLDAPLGLDHGDRLVDVLWHHVPAVQHHAGHVLSL